MNPNDLNITVSAGWIAVFILTACIPAILWAWTVQRALKEILHMHRDPAQSAATAASQRLVKELYDSTAQLHANNTKVIQDNTLAIHQLSHYIRWFSRNVTGQDLPPEIPGDHQ
jgi:hypothetical protein